MLRAEESCPLPPSIRMRSGRSSSSPAAYQVAASRWNVEGHLRDEVQSCEVPHPEGTASLGELSRMTYRILRDPVSCARLSATARSS